MVVALCQQGFRVIRYDNRDVGLSTWRQAPASANLTFEVLRYKLALPVAAPYTLTDMADDALGLMDALSIDPLEEASEEKAPKPEEKGGLDRWLVHVNPIDREILVLRFVAELEFQEIADIMHMGLSATKMRYKRALDKLREKFAGIAET